MRYLTTLLIGLACLALWSSLAWRSPDSTTLRLALDNPAAVIATMIALFIAVGLALTRKD